MIAAGAALWRHDPDTGELHVAVIHRPRYDDWSLPKGKVDPGENEPIAAVREIWEETGQRSVLGRRLIQTHYPIPQGTKIGARDLGGNRPAVCSGPSPDPDALPDPAGNQDR
ncbi:NUDIX hydrolase, partial [Mycolicibacterium gadium]|uniref:NUDIX hydrolase n=1 Tax=Mycolicibacterium gadium TaxID=1794 RepID=UPI0021F31A0D